MKLKFSKYNLQLFLLLMIPLFARAEENTSIECNRFSNPRTGFFINGEFLYWKVNENGSDFAIKRTVPINPDIGAGMIGEVYEGEFEWQPGFRLGIGYQFKPDLWKAEGIYTYYQSGSTQTVKHPTQGIADPNLASLNATLNGDLGNATAKARSTTNFIYHSVDGLISKELKMSPYFYLTLNAGVKGLWGRQHWHVDYRDIVDNLGKHRMNWKYDGVGPEFGTEVHYYLGSGFSIDVAGAFSFLYGKKTQDQSYTLYLVDSSVTGVFKFQDFSISKHTTLPTSQIKMALSWGKVFMDWLEFSVHAGYEVNGLYNINEDYRFIGGTNAIDERSHTYWQTSVFIQGFTGGFYLHF